MIFSAGRHTSLHRPLRTVAAGLGHQGADSQKLHPLHAGAGNHPERPGEPELFHDWSHLIRWLMYIDKENFEAWMERIMDRLDMQDKKIDRLLNSQNCLDGEKLLDNQDLCFLLKVSVKTLQRYRKKGSTALPAAGREVLLPGKRHTQADFVSARISGCFIHRSIT